MTTVVVILFVACCVGGAAWGGWKLASGIGETSADADRIARKRWD